MPFIDKSDLDTMLQEGILVYSHFMGEVKIGKKVLSPIRKERHPSFSIYFNSSKSKYFWKDNGSGKFGGHWDFIGAMTGLSYKESLDYAKQNILNLGSFGIDNSRVNAAALQLSRTPIKKTAQIRAVITVEFRLWNAYDQEFFMRKNGMSCKEMQACLYRPVSSVHVVKSDKSYTIYEGKNNPIYAICFPSGNYKIYRPMENVRNKWLSNVDRETDFYLLENCKGGDLLVITAGNRDCAAVRKHLKVDAFALLSETALLPFEVYNRITLLYDKIIVLYDNDKAGYEGAKKLKQEYGFDSLNHLYKPFGVGDFCELYEKGFEKFSSFALSFYSEI
jgi:hypothetical protein